MANKPSPLSLFLTLLVLLHGCVAQQRPARFEEFRNECQLDQLNALEPSHTVQCEAGRIDLWDPNSRQLQCAGVSVVRSTIEPKGLYLPSFHNTPQISFVVEGRGLVGRSMPGCAETFMDSQGFEGRESQRGQQGEFGGQGRRFRDMHQKVEQLRKGDVFVAPAGVAQWLYNNGDQPLVVVCLLDIANHENQLDRNARWFYLAGNTPRGQEWEQQGQEGRSRAPRNMLQGFDPQMLAQALSIDVQLAEQLQNRDDNRGNIVMVKGGFDVIRPPSRSEWGGQEEEYRHRRPGQDNGLEETFCSMRFHENLDDPSRADVYKPQLGRISTLNSMTLPILRHLRLSALRGSVHGNAVVLPHWNINANEVIYVTRGQARVQVVNDNGQQVFNEELREGQLLTVPQGFAVVKRAERDRFEWIAFKTNDNAMINTLAGRTSVMRALPLDVIANAYQISLDEARRVKFNTLETTLTQASSGQSYGVTAEA